jgi:hypothetical protein
MAAKTRRPTGEWLLTGDEPEQDVRAQTANEEAALRLLRRIPWKLPRRKSARAVGDVSATAEGAFLCASYRSSPPP